MRIIETPDANNNNTNTNTVPDIEEDDKTIIIFPES